MFKNAQIRNILWMFIDKAFLLVGGFVVSVMVARYLGPEQLGLISYGLALGTLLVAISQWGANYTIFNTAAKKPIRSGSYIVNSTKFRLYIYILSFFVINLWLYYFGQYSDINYNVVFLVILSQVFLALDIYQFHYNAILKSKINARSSIIAKTTSMILRLAFLYLDLGVIFFVIPFFIEGYIIYKLRSSAFIKEPHNKNQPVYLKSYLSNGLPLVVTGVCVAVYTKMYELMLGNIVSYNAVGIYSVGLAINSAWSFIPMSIGISLFSVPMKANNKNDMLTGFSFVTLIMLLSSLPVLIGICFFSSEIVHFTFGEEYSQSADILLILAISSLCSTLGFITNRMINVEKGGGVYILKKSLFSSIIMFFVSYFFVSKYGVYGAACAYLLSELINLTLFNYLFRNGLIFKVHINLFTSFFYYKKYI
jgi:O-antigen/teichoic acid export membrane protein